ncbi:MAG: M15 family metallopeptidase [Actinomycetota bacterium]
MKRGLAGNVAFAIVGAIVGASVVLGVDGLTRAPEPTTTPPAEAPSPEPSPLGRISPSKTVLLVWAPFASGGLPATTERVLEALPGVRNATTVLAGLDWVSSSRSSDGTPLDQPPKGFAIPVEAVAIEPREYAAFVPAAERGRVEALSPGDVLLAETEADLRSADEGAQLDLQDGTARVAGVVSDIGANGYEVLMARPAPASWERVDRFVLMHLKRSSARASVEREIKDLLGDGRVFRLRARGETPYMRYGDAVLPQMLIKRVFGEFAARPRSDGTLDVDESWRRKNITSARVPLLGRITCHRVLLPQIRNAMRDLQANGLDFLVDQYSGCYSPRFIDRNPSGRLSHHSWGIAVDINAAENQFGTKPDQDPRLVNVMEDWGFTWGGRWLVPDGMHFEWARFP